MKEGHPSSDPHDASMGLICEFCRKKIEIAEAEPGEIKLTMGEKTQVIVAHSRCFREAVRVVS
jgi:hypothetical protein